MTIEKTYKLTIKGTSYFITEEEVSSLYEQCRQALNISATNPNWPIYPPGVRKFDPVVPTDKITPSWPTYPLPNTYCGNVPFGTIHCTDNSVMDSGTSISTANVPSSKGINFISDDMATIKNNDNWRSSVQQSLDKLNNVTKDGNFIKACNGKKNND